MKILLFLLSLLPVYLICIFLFQLWNVIHILVLGFLREIQLVLELLILFLIHIRDKFILKLLLVNCILLVIIILIINLNLWASSISSLKAFFVRRIKIYSFYIRWLLKLLERCLLNILIRINYIMTLIHA